MEPAEGKGEFALVDGLIQEARRKRAGLILWPRLALRLSGAAELMKPFSVTSSPPKQLLSSQPLGPPDFGLEPLRMLSLKAEGYLACRTPSLKNNSPIFAATPPAFKGQPETDATTSTRSGTNRLGHENPVPGGLVPATGTNGRPTSYSQKR
jgi:hypothetical protein